VRFKTPIRGPIWALLCLSLGGLLLHLRIHPPGESPFNYIPLVFTLVTALLVPVAFNYRRTVAWAFVLNTATVIVGVVTMAYYSARGWQSIPNVLTLTTDSSALTYLTDIVLRVMLWTTLPDILVLLAKLPLGLHILRYFRPNGQWADTGGQA